MWKVKAVGEVLGGGGSRWCRGHEEDDAAARSNPQCAGTAATASAACHRGQPQTSLRLGWLLWEAVLLRPDQCGFGLCAVHQFRLWWIVQGGPGCGSTLNHDCQVGLVFTALLPVTGRGWKASNHLWSGTRLF